MRPRCSDPESGRSSLGNLSKMAAGRDGDHDFASLVHAGQCRRHLGDATENRLMVGGMKLLRVAPPPTTMASTDRKSPVASKGGGRRNPQTAIDFLPDADEIERRPLPIVARMTVHLLVAALLVF